MSTPHPHLHLNELQCLTTPDFWSQELRLLKIDPLALEKIARAMAMSCFVRSVYGYCIEVGHSVEFAQGVSSDGIPKKDRECFVTLQEADMALYSQAFAGSSTVNLDNPQYSRFNADERNYTGSPSKTRWSAADYMLAAVKRLVGPTYEVRLGYYSSQYRSI